jgi:hypothetical protein
MAISCGEECQKIKTNQYSTLGQPEKVLKQELYHFGLTQKSPKIKGSLSKVGE